ncbi:MAG: hypothetical protein GC191_16260 [Azospirillum sp.]|nr:hypothetical protein [Azospirillum sp.]
MGSHPAGFSLRRLAIGVASAAALLAVGACASAPSGPDDAVSKAELAEYRVIVGELERASKCVIQVESEPRFQSLHTKTPDQGTTDPRFFVDASRATPQQAEAVLDFVGAMAACRPYLGEMSFRVHRNIARLIIDTWDRQQRLYGELRGGTITWGQFNLESKHSADRLSGALEALRLTDQV